MDVLVFKTTVETPQHVQSLKPLLDLVVGRDGWNFALEDRDRILRITVPHVGSQVAIQLLQHHGYECSELED